MRVTLTPEGQQIVDEMIASSRFASAEEVVVEALRQFQAWRTIQHLAPAFDEAIAEYERGEAKPLDFDEIKRKVRDLAMSKRGKTSADGIE